MDYLKYYPYYLFLEQVFFHKFVGEKKEETFSDEKPSLAWQKSSVSLEVLQLRMPIAKVVLCETELDGEL